MGDLAKAYVQIVPSARGMKEGLTSIVNGEMPSGGKSAGGIFGSNLVGKIKSVITVAAIGKALSSSITAGAELEQSLGGVETLFKGSAATVIANAEQGTSGSKRRSGNRIAIQSVPGSGWQIHSCRRGAGHSE